MADRLVPLSRLRPVWLALPVLPWLASLVPWLAAPFSVPWFALALYFWPAEWIAHACGLPALDPRRHLFTFAYALALALLFDVAMRQFARSGGEWRQIGARSAASLVAALAFGTVAITALLYAQWIDWPARPAALADQPLYELRAHAAQIRELLVYELPGGFIDREYVARIRSEPRLFAELTDLLALQPISERDVPESFWTAPPAYWWQPPRTGHFYATRDFSWSERGRDGDHYLFMQTSGEELWLWHKANF